MSFVGSAISAGVSSHEAKKQRQWQEKMMKRAYQYTMADMRKAGLNPILAYKTGPTGFGQGAMAHTPDMGQAMASDAKAAMAYKKLDPETQLINEQKKTQVTAQKLNTELGFKAQMEAERAYTEGNLLSVQEDKLRSQAPRWDEENKHHKSKYGRLLNQYRPFLEAGINTAKGIGALGNIIPGLRGRKTTGGSTQPVRPSIDRPKVSYSDHYPLERW